MPLVSGSFWFSNNPKPLMKIFAVAYNYPGHNKAATDALYNREDPVVFTKADSSLLKGGRPMFLPDDLAPVDGEVELVVRICRLGKSIPERFACRYYDAVTCGVDFTARNLLLSMQQQGLPWELSKGFDGAAAIGEWMPVEGLDRKDIRFQLDINGNPVQQGVSSGMIHSIDAVIAYISRWYTLRTGDLIFTGAPSAAVVVKENDHITGFINNEKLLEFNVK